MSNNLYNLIEMYKNGEKDRLGIIIEKFNPTIKKFSRSLFYEEGETDLIIFTITLIQKMNLDYFRNKNEGVLVNYIYYSIKNKYIDMYRKCKNTSIMETELITEILYDEASYNFEESVIMRILLEALNEKELFIITELYYTGNKYKDIEDKLHISRQSVYNIRNKALNKLKRTLEKWALHLLNRSRHYISE